MNIGKRIESRLTVLKWERKDLLGKVDGLTVQALGALITRDSKRSEWDEKIAAALGVSVLWLVYGREDGAEPQALKGRLSARMERICELVEAMDEEGQAIAEGVLIGISAVHKKRKVKKRASSFPSRNIAPRD